LSSLRNSKGGYDDKALNKCHTTARKYFILGLFQIPTGLADDADAEEDKPPVNAAEQAAKAFSAKAIKDIGATKNMEALVSWGLAWAKQVEKLRANYPDEAKFVDAAIKAQELSFGGVK